MDIENLKSTPKDISFKQFDDKSVYDGIYIPFGEKYDIKLKINLKTKEIIEMVTVSENSSVISKPGEGEKLMLDALKLPKTEREDVEAWVIFHSVSCIPGKLTNKPEGNLGKSFMYLYCVSVQDMEVSDDITYLPLENWSECRYVKDNYNFFNAQDIDSTSIYLKTIGENFLKTISEKNPFAKPAGMRGSKGNGYLYIPRQNFLRQRTSSWVYVK